MLKQLIRNIQEKPKSTRDSIAFSVAFFVTLVLFAGWLYNMPTRHAAIDAKFSDDPESDSPGFSQLFDGVSKKVGDIKQSVGENLSSSTLEEVKSDLEQEFELVDISELTISSTTKTSDENSEFKFDTESSEPPPREVRIITTPKATNTAPSSQTD